MKITNPTKFISISSASNSTKEYFEKNAKLLSVGDVIRLFATSDSNISSDWHLIKTNNDTWVKYSFDGGATWILKFKFKNQLLVPITNMVTDNTVADLSNIEVSNANNEKLKSGYIHTFDFSTYAIEYFEMIKKSVLSFLAVSVDNQFYTALPNFRYMFDDSTKSLKVVFLEDLPLDTVSIKVNCQLDGSDSLALTLPSSIWTNADLSSGEGSVQE